VRFGESVTSDPNAVSVSLVRAPTSARRSCDTLTAMVALALTAARNNADWCDALCRTHGAPTTLDEVAWTSRTRTPPFYPDAVTLVPEPDVPSLLARLDNAAGCSIKPPGTPEWSQSITVGPWRSSPASHTPPTPAYRPTVRRCPRLRRPNRVARTSE
jgi:hypothetical protein